MRKKPVLLAVALVTTVLGVAHAGEPHQEWMRYLKGHWKYEYSVLSGDDGVLKGEVTYRLASKGKTLVARGVEGNDKWVELIGWQADRKKMVFLGYGTNNDNYWHAEYDELRNDRLGGSISGIMPDGRVSESGKIVLEKVNDDEFEVHFKAEVGDEEIMDVGKFKRVSDDVHEEDDDEDEDEDDD